MHALQGTRYLQGDEIFAVVLDFLLDFLACKKCLEFLPNETPDFAADVVISLSFALVGHAVGAQW